MPAGQGHRQLDLDEGRRGRVPASRRARCAATAPPSVVMAFDEQGQADTCERKVEICTRAYRMLTERGRLPARGHHLRPQHLRHRHRHRGAQQLRGRLHRGRARSSAATPAALPHLRRRLQRVVLVPRQRTGAPGDPRRCSCTTRSAPAWTWASSTPARCRSTTTSTRNCASASRTWCSTAARTPPNACWRSPSATRARRAKKQVEDLALAREGRCARA